MDEGQREPKRETGRWEKVAAWRPVRRGKNDRALTRYKSHYGVNLLDPSPPKAFQPPGTVLGCRLWATSHANSDKVPLSLSSSPSFPLSQSILLLHLSLSFLQPSTYCQRTILVTFHLSSLCHSFHLFFSVSLVLFSRLSPLAASQGHPNPYGPEPGNICPWDICVLIESPISSLIERTIGRFSLSPFPLFSVPLWFALKSFRSRKLNRQLGTQCDSFARCGISSWRIVSVKNKNSVKHCSGSDTAHTDH